jgi:hypothetical protein
MILASTSCRNCWLDSSIARARGYLGGWNSAGARRWASRCAAFAPLVRPRAASSSYASASAGKRRTASRHAASASASRLCATNTRLPDRPLQHHGLPVPSLARWLLGLGIAATLTANMAQGWSHGPVGAVVAAWPAVSLVGSYELLVRLIRTAGTLEQGPPAEPVSAGQPAAYPGPAANAPKDEEEATEADSVNDRAVAAYRLSVQAGSPLLGARACQHVRTDFPPLGAYPDHGGAAAGCPWSGMRDADIRRTCVRTYTMIHNDA